MILIYILSILSLGSLFIENPNPIQIEQKVEESDVKPVDTKKTMKTTELPKYNQEILLGDENNVNEEEIQNLEILENDELYEEIIFYDDFDKEYRSGTENNYLEE